MANFVPWVQTGNLLFVSGQIPSWNGELRYVGRVGAEIGVDDARAAAVFRHEAEVRVIYVEQRGIPPESVFRVEIDPNALFIDPNALFDDITFDPRLDESERNQREAVIRTLGYTGQLSVSGLYQDTSFEIALGQKSGG